MTTRVIMPKDQWLSLADIKLRLSEADADLLQYQWLAEYGSMTSCLTEAAGEPLDVEVLSSNEQELSAEEKSFLALNNRNKAYVREVIMSIDDSPWLYGRTVVPHETLKGDGEQLKQLGTKPLGQLLFKNNVSSRLFIEVAVITKNHFLYPDLVSNIQQKHLWARRSMFLFNDSPLMVQEVFMPACAFLQPD